MRCSLRNITFYHRAYIFPYLTGMSRADEILRVSPAFVTDKVKCPRTLFNGDHVKELRTLSKLQRSVIKNVA